MCHAVVELKVNGPNKELRDLNIQSAKWKRKLQYHFKSTYVDMKEELLDQNVKKESLLKTV